MLDSKDEVYAATDPDGKIYKIGADGKPKLFYDPHQKYIWAMAFNSKGDLFVATGDQGEIHRVTPSGTGSVFFKTEETHARSLAIDAKDNLIVGTEPSGLILRISPAGQGFVLYQSPKREITSIAVTPGRRDLRLRRRQQNRRRASRAAASSRCLRGHAQYPASATRESLLLPEARDHPSPVARKFTGSIPTVRRARSGRARRISFTPSDSMRAACRWWERAIAAKSIAWIPTP